MPWRLAQWLDKTEMDILRRHYDRKILATRPFRTGEDCPDFELHSLLGHKHVTMCLWAIKSFLHCTGKKYSVYLHDDGSLTQEDAELLEKHLVGVKIMRRDYVNALMDKELQGFEHCREYRFCSRETSDHRGTNYNMLIFALRLFDFNFVSKANKIFILDADVLFFNRPTEIMEWAEAEGDGSCLYTVEQYLPVWNSHYEIERFECKDPLPTDLNAGILCFDKRAYDLKIVDEWIGANKDLMYKVATFEQRAYNYLVHRQGTGRRLPSSYAFNYTGKDVVATHFAIKTLFFRNLRRAYEALR